MDGRTEFESRVRRVVMGLRKGEVATYGEVAEEAGFPGAARAVGNVLARSEGLPWWRVVSATGRLVPGHESEHARRLRQEGFTIPRGHLRRSNKRTRSFPMSAFPE
ncbi:MAG TPA: MGMT family protein [Actinomycetota bacterium]|nr:MGMT family protein [Actinomycetota bacterium]